MVQDFSFSRLLKNKTPKQQICLNGLYDFGKGMKMF